MLDSDYDDYIKTIATVIFQRKNTLIQDMLLHLSEEVGEVAEAFSLHLGSNPRKPAVGSLEDVCDELADVVCTALTAIAFIGASPKEVLQRQMAKTKSRFPEVWEPRS